MLGFSRLDGFIVTAVVGVSNLFWLPVSGFVSDKIGRKPVLLTMTFLGMISAYPMLSLLADASSLSFTKFILVELWFSFIFGAYNGAMIVSLTEVIPKQVKALGFSFSYSIAVAIFGGFTPTVATLLKEFTGQVQSPAYWLTFAAICSFISAMILFKKGGIYERNNTEK